MTAGGQDGGSRIARYLPILGWARDYDRRLMANDLAAAAIVTIMLIPQSLAYALLAGLPPEAGLYASILPLAAYAVFGTSRTLAVGPVAVVSLMTATAVGKLALQGTPEYLTAALTLAFLSGALLVVLGALRLGFLSSFLSHPVIAGFITASGVLIAASQIKHILGISGTGDTLPEIAASLAGSFGAINPPTLVLGVFALAFLLWARRGLKPFLTRLGTAPHAAGIAARTAPIAAVAATTLAAWGLGLAEAGVQVVGDVPRGLPRPTLPSFDPDLWRQLAGSAVLISVIGFVESVAVAQTLAARRRQRIDPDQELVALGAANIAAGASGGFPVTGGFARSAVNFDAGAETPAAGIFTAAGIALAALFLTPLLYFLPQATLAATIIAAVLSLVDFSVFRRTWIYSKGDFAAVAATVLLTLTVGVEAGISAGVGLSVLLFLYRSSRPHMAEVGLVRGTEHFRNVLRHEVATGGDVLSIRVDESLYFANARYLEDRLYDLVAARPDLKHVVLMCTAVNEIDASALESLEAINLRLKELGVAFHLSEVKGPVMDRLRRSDLPGKLTGRIFLSQFQAVAELDPATARLARQPSAAPASPAEAYAGSHPPKAVPPVRQCGQASSTTPTEFSKEKKP